MRILDPKDAEERKRRILNWAVHSYVLSGKPVSSEFIASNCGLKVSSATIRNILKELEEEGYLQQLHTSGGRIPTDKGYRTYVNNVLEIENQALIERERVEREYNERMEQIDSLLKNTSRIVANLSKWAGLVFAGDTEGDSVRRIDLILLNPQNVLMIIINNTGIIKHFSIPLSSGRIGRKALYSLSEEINKKIKDVPLKRVADIIWKEFISATELDTAESEIFKKIYNYFSYIGDESEEIYLDGLMKISEHLESDNVEDFRNIMRIVDDKKRFSSMLKERLKDAMEKHKKAAADNQCREIEIVIGSESGMKEFGNFSLVSSAYCLNDRALGLVGVLGHKRMDYPKVISIVDAVSSVIEDVLSEWSDTGEDYD